MTMRSLISISNRQGILEITSSGVATITWKSVQTVDSVAHHARLLDRMAHLDHTCHEDGVEFHYPDGGRVWIGPKIAIYMGIVKLTPWSPDLQPFAQYLKYCSYKLLLATV